MEDAVADRDVGSLDVGRHRRGAEPTDHGMPGLSQGRRSVPPRVPAHLVTLEVADRPVKLPIADVNDAAIGAEGLAVVRLGTLGTDEVPRVGRPRR